MHEGMNNRYALIAVGSVAKSGEPFLDGFFNRLPAPPQPGSTEPTFISLNDIKLSLASAILMPQKGKTGRKSHLPISTRIMDLCPHHTEDVKYFILKQNLRVTSDQITRLRAILPDGQMLVH